MPSYLHIFVHQESRKKKFWWKILLTSRTINDMAAATNVFSQNADKGFVNAVFHRCTVCLELRDSDQVEFLSSRVEQCETERCVRYQRRT